mmetsp:Transcript_25984/g.57742  ORF Transcript_25984/g.57742 Transcript_25984/m.57742 type:complete len:657 (+) Transcript_25984:22-1992(+)
MYWETDRKTELPAKKRNGRSMWGVVVAVFKPFVLLWAGLNAIDDLALLIRVGRLGASVIPFPGKNLDNPEEMCGVCDDVMGDLMRGNDGLSAIPCGAACLGLQKCVRMCERVQEVSAESNEFPCVAAGFCDAVEAGDMTIADPECSAGAFFSCKPRRYCRRKRQGLKMTCELKPGIGRWVGMKDAAREHAGALAAGLMAQAHCGEEGAGPYCIARPRGFGLIAEAVGHFISVVIGGYKSIVAIETPGGGDDRQWLTFWLILTIVLFVERFFARVVLSRFPWYYEAKLAALVWLVWQSGAETCYRKLRRILEKKELLYSDQDAAEKELEIMQSAGQIVIEKRLNYQASVRRMSQFKTEDWSYDEEEGNNRTSLIGEKPDAIRQLYELSKFILSAEGAKTLEQSTDISRQEKMLLIERAASVVSFQPRFLRVTVVGTVDGPNGQLPPMDRNGLADPYVTCRLVPEDGGPYPQKGISSKTAYKTISPQWSQELEIPLRGGTLDSDGFFHSEDVVDTTQLEVVVRDADVGLWHIVYYLFRFLAVVVVILAAASRIEGLSDDLTQSQRYVAMGTASFVAIGYVLSYVMAVLRRADDEYVAQCLVPICMLMDQREHALLLTLREPKAEQQVDGKGTENGGIAARNATGGFGVLRVRLMLSEH